MTFIDNDINTVHFFFGFCCLATWLQIHNKHVGVDYIMTLPTPTGRTRKTRSHAIATYQHADSRYQQVAYRCFRRAFDDIADKTVDQWSSDRHDTDRRCWVNYTACRLDMSLARTRCKSLLRTALHAHHSPDTLSTSYPTLWCLDTTTYWLTIVSRAAQWLS